jgi:ribosome-associated toxin RatA of RatAB toxin-antitoxin module
MKTIHKSVMIWFSNEEMFSLVADVPKYPEFLPWCESGQVDQTYEDGVSARIGMSLAGFKKSFTTRNYHIAGRQIKVNLLDGPFKHLDGLWNFIPLGEERACRVELTLNYSFDSVFGALVGPIFDKIADSLVDSFVSRAEKIYS